MAHVPIYAPLCLAAGAIFPPLCSGVVALRFYARKQEGNQYRIDDWLTVPALVREKLLSIISETRLIFH